MKHLDALSDAIAHLNEAERLLLNEVGTTTAVTAAAIVGPLRVGLEADLHSKQLAHARFWTDEVIQQRLVVAMKQQHLTMRDASAALGIPYRTLQNQLKGNNRITAQLCLQLAVWLRLDLLAVSAAPSTSFAGPPPPLRRGGPKR